MVSPQVQVLDTGYFIKYPVPAACCDELAAVEFLERHRWEGHPGCPHCGDTNVYQMQASGGGREKYYRWRCRGCKQQFSVRTGTVYEDSLVPLRHWCYAFWRASTSNKGVSALEIKRQTGLSYKSALFLLHRIRYAMAPAEAGQLGGTVEVDETYVGDGEYVRGDVSTNTCESFFSLVKRGMHGIYHAVSRKHLHRYLARAEFLWNNRELEGTLGRYD